MPQRELNIKTRVETPQQNGVVECKHQHLLGVARALMVQSNLPRCFWNYAVSHAAHLINRLPTPFLHNLNPYEALFYSHMICLNYECLAALRMHLPLLHIERN